MTQQRTSGLTLAILGSGSSGNAAIVQGPCGPILIDAGLSGRQLTQRLEQLEIHPGDLKAILITHEHGDHTRGLEVLCRRVPDVPVVCTSHTRAVIKSTAGKTVKNWLLLEAGSQTSFHGLGIESFSVPHDAVDPVGFVIEDQASGSRLGFASDLGHTPPAVHEKLQGLDALFVEANYCPNMLAQDMKRPWSVKQRIAGRHGHLSNLQVGELIAAVASDRLRQLVLGHLSSDCNSAVAVQASLNAVLTTLGLHQSVSLHCATQDQVLGPLAISAPPREVEISRLDHAALAAASWSQLELF